ncbi:hypothetical protein A3B46_03270 [Candidatus Roizmanbacteria bacterium RIFCSPLOWO2_01_FULL_39_19]|nr:MAG: hypothetical protein A3B46_03270 [Candidatus Roizmanbacteria bacterium RIFCSPLOWO2_01_FULL_39_19]
MAMLIITLSTAYYFVIFLPQKEWTKIDLQKKEQQATDRQKVANRAYLNICLSGADSAYSEHWDSECKVRGLKEDCSLPFANADRNEELRRKSKDECFKKYPID